MNPTAQQLAAANQEVADLVNGHPMSHDLTRWIDQVLAELNNGLSEIIARWTELRDETLEPRIAAAKDAGIDPTLVEQIAAKARRDVGANRCTQVNQLRALIRMTNKKLERANGSLSIELIAQLPKLAQAHCLMDRDGRSFQYAVKTKAETAFNYGIRQALPTQYGSLDEADRTNLALRTAYNRNVKDL